MSDQSCPNCGTPVPFDLQLAKMATCDACDTTLFIDGELLEVAGKSGEMHDAPQLISVGAHVVLDGGAFVVLGHARFDYGQGWWDEYWIVDEADRGAWVSVDEGDVIIQRPVNADAAPQFIKVPELGATVMNANDNYTVIERSKGTCIAVRGRFGELLKVGETFE